MIVRYFIDGDFIRKEVSAPETRRMVFVWLKELLRSVQENGIFIVNMLHDRKPLAEALKQLDSDDDTDLRDLIGAFVDAFDTDNDSHIPKVISDKKLPADLSLREYLSACTQKPYLPDCIITDDSKVREWACDKKKSGASAPEVVSLNSYMKSTTEKTRFSWMKMQSFGVNSAQQKMDRARIEVYLNHFLFRAKSVQLIDPCLGTWRPPFEESLGYILSLCAKQGVQNVTITTAADQNMPNGEVKQPNTKKLSEIMGRHLKGIPHLFGTLTVTISNPHKNDMKAFHDRLMATDEHVFAIGRGFDVLEEEDTTINRFHIYCCGRWPDVRESVETITKGSSKEKAPRGICSPDPFISDQPDLKVKFLTA